jgi:hypothetical protein
MSAGEHRKVLGSKQAIRIAPFKHNDTFTGVS